MTTGEGHRLQDDVRQGEASAEHADGLGHVLDRVKLDRLDLLTAAECEVTDGCDVGPGERLPTFSQNAKFTKFVTAVSILDGPVPSMSLSAISLALASDVAAATAEMIMTFFI